MHLGFGVILTTFSMEHRCRLAGKSLSLIINPINE
jgi:hypothetical protein